MSDLLELKSKAFDLLMDVMDGKEKEVGYNRYVGEFKNKDRRHAEVSTMDVPIYEWTIRMKGRKDLADAMLCYAAKAISKAKA